MRYALNLLAAFTLSSVVLIAQPPNHIDKNGLAVKGFDPVAYHPEYGGEPTKGRKTITAEYRGATYRFTNEANRDVFLEQPAAYTPAYGGWCAYAMAEGEKITVDPKRFEIHDGRLYMFYRDWFTDTLKPWQENRETLSQRADEHWVRLIEEAHD